MADINSVNVSNTDYLVSGVNTIISCSTAVGTQAKTATAPKGFTLDSGISFLIKFTNGNTHATPSLNLTPDGGTALGAKSLVGLSGNTLTANVIYTCYYDGTQFKIDNNCTSHISNTSNPHSVTKTQVSLGNVANRSIDTTSSKTSTNYIQNNVATNIANGFVCSTASNTSAKTTDTSGDYIMTGFSLIPGATVRVLFKNGNTASNPTLNVNGTGAKKIVVCNKNKLYYPTLHTGFWDGASTSGTATSRMWDNFISFELMYLSGNQNVYNPSTDTATTENGVWVIMGNPTVNSYYNTNGGYTVYANGLIVQWLKHSGSDNAYTQCNFPINFTNTNYSIFIGNIDPHTGGNCIAMQESSKTNSNTKIYYYGSTSANLLFMGY